MLTFICIYYENGSNLISPEVTVLVFYYFIYQGYAKTLPSDKKKK